MNPQSVGFPATDRLVGSVHAGRVHMDGFEGVSPSRVVWSELGMVLGGSGKWKGCNTRAGKSRGGLGREPRAGILALVKSRKAGNILREDRVWK